MRFPILFLLVSLALLGGTCKEDNPTTRYKTRHVVILVIDGPRWSETWGDNTHANIPLRSSVLKPMGVFVDHFRNDGWTYTNSGHTALTTGFYEPINNSGLELPRYPSIFQYWRKQYNEPTSKAWVVASKDKLYILADSKDTTMRSWNASYDCGLNGPFTGYRHDTITYRRTREVLNLYHPDMLLVNFREPDFSAHQANWTNYIAGIRKTDQYVHDLVQFLRSDPYYAGTTTIFITNDHGRHFDNIPFGYTTHGDGCEGCRQIELMAIGPDFKVNYTTPYTYDQRDVSRTIATLMNFDMPTGNGRVMWDLFQNIDHQ
jgi:Metalloenzyme superfamily